jgi:hypothetical protein
VSQVTVQHAFNSNAYGSGATAAQAFGSNVTAGNSVVWFASSQDFATNLQSVFTVTDSQINTYVTVGSIFFGGIATLSWGYCKTIASTGALTVTATVTSGPTNPGNNNYTAIHIQEVSGVDQSAPFHTGETASQGQSSPGTGTNAVSSGNTPTLFTQPATLYGCAFDINSLTAAAAGYRLHADR